MTIDKAQLKARLRTIERMRASGWNGAPVFDEQTVRALVAEIEQLEDALHGASTEVHGLAAQHGRDSAELRRLCQARDEARRERDQLKAENESLRKDAERYRWLRDAENDAALMFGGHAWEDMSSEYMDQAIDAAMAKESSHD